MQKGRVKSGANFHRKNFSATAETSEDRMNKPKPRITKRKSRRKLGAREYKNYTAEMLEIAVESVANKTISSRDAEKQFGIPRRTILNKLKNIHSKPVGTPTKLSNEEEVRLINVVIASADYGSPLTKLDLRMLVHNYLQRHGKEYLFNGKMPGEKWANSFLSRHAEKLTVRATQNISSARAHKSESEILEYFGNLSETLKAVPPANILNYDETNCSDNPGSSKAIFRRGVKYPERIANSTKGCISLMFSATADGNCLPPYVVYKAEHLYSEWVLNGPDKARYNCTKSGWFDSGMFEDYFRTIVLDWAKNLPGTKVVIGDNLSSHISPEVVELCERHNIKFSFLPPNSTHITQPLDIAFFGPLKKEWRKILLEYKTQNPDQKTLNKKHFPALLNKIMENIQIRQSKNIKSGFKAAGICPLNPREVLKRIPNFEYYADSNANEIDQSLLEYLKQSREPNPMKTVRNKKIHIQPGKSVSSSDFQELNLSVPREKTNKPKKVGIKQIKINKTNAESQNFNERTGILNKQVIEMDDDMIVEYDEDMHSKYDKKGQNSHEERVQDENDATLSKLILDDTTGFMKAVVLTTASIEIPKRQSLTENWKLTPKGQILGSDDIFDENKENFISYGHQHKKISNITNQQNLKKEKCTKPAKSKIRSNSSTTTEDVVMSVHSDSDLYCVSEFDDDFEIQESYDGFRKNVNKREAEIFDEIRRLHENYEEKEGSAAETIEDEYYEYLEDEKIIETSKMCEVNRNEKIEEKVTTRTELTTKETRTTEQIKNEADCETGTKNNTEIEKVSIGDTVLVRYYLKDNWKYFIGLVIDISNKLENKYKITYYKTIRRKGMLKFTTSKRRDEDYIPGDLIVKQIEILQINDYPEEFVLNNEEDSVYF